VSNRKKLGRHPKLVLADLTIAAVVMALFLLFVAALVRTGGNVQWS
jgi:cell division protein FtsL